MSDTTRSSSWSPHSSGTQFKLWYADTIIWIRKWLNNTCSWYYYYLVIKLCRVVCPQSYRYSSINKNNRSTWIETHKWQAKYCNIIIIVIAIIMINIVCYFSHSPLVSHITDSSQWISYFQYNSSELWYAGTIIKRGNDWITYAPAIIIVRILSASCTI